MRRLDFVARPSSRVWAILLLGCIGSAHAYPDRPIRIVAPFPPGSVVDVLARPVGPKLAEAWGQSVVIDNRSGMGGSLGAEIAAKASPDGYTLLMGTNGTNAINMSLYPKMPYDTRKDFAPITRVATSFLLLTFHPSMPVTSVKELIALAKARPGELTFGSAGSGTTPHLAGELFKSMAGVDLTHVTYKGSPQAAIDLIAGRLSLGFSNASTVLPHIRAGKLRAVAVTALKREPALPDLPTIAESGLPGFEATPWFALFAPAGTPTAIISKLNAEVVRILALPDIKSHYANLGLTAVSSTPAELAEFVEREIVKWAKVVKASGAKVQ